MSEMWQHQREAHEWVLDRFDSGEPALLDMGMGTGKTRVAIETLRSLQIGYPARFRVLVGCPKAVIDAWTEKQLPMWLPGIRVLPLTQATSKKKGEALAAALADTTPLVVVGNYESLWRIPEIGKTEWSLVVWDEVHRLKSHRGRAAKWAKKMAQGAPETRFLGMSGTLLAQNLLDAYGVWWAVGSPIWGKSFTAFRARYSVSNPAIPGMVIGWRNQAEMSRIIAETTFRRTTEQVIKWLPELTHESLEFDLTTEEARVYRELVSEFAADVDDGTITPANAMVGVLRLLQVCGGFCRLDEESTPYRLVDRPAKQARLGELLTDIPVDEPLVVFCRFRDDIDSVRAECELHGRSVSELSGRMNDLCEWQAGKTSTLVAQIQSGGIGIDLTRASLGVFYSVGHSLSEFLQAVARLHRPGQENATRFYSLVARIPGRTKPTVERGVYEALREKKDVITRVLEGFRNRRAADAHGAGSNA
jgi:SNF2 family DNA or RNA helicase